MSFPALGRGAKPYEIENAINRILRWLNPGLDSGAADKVLTSTGDDLQWQDLPVQNLLQMVSFETGAVATGTTQLPLDNTIPQNTEGDQYMSLSITPKSATSKLVIEIVWIGAKSSTQGTISVALFQDSTSNALAAAASGPANGADFIQTIAFRHAMVSGTTSSTTFKVRAGVNMSATTTFNGISAGTRVFGGVCASTMIIREYA